ncbi:hypothetical protein Dimus_000826, partial [Dionaea muscipula]
GQKWERLFRRRELMHIDACKEFYANLTMFHYKKHEVARSRVRGVDIEFNSMRLANSRSFDVPLIDKQGEEPKRYDFFEETFLTMCQLKRENGVWWLGTGDHRRRDDDVEEVNVNTRTLGTLGLGRKGLKTRLGLGLLARPDLEMTT